METAHGALTSLLPVNAIVDDWAGRVPQEPPSAVRISGTSGRKVKAKTDVDPVCLRFNDAHLQHHTRFRNKMYNT